MTTRLLLAISVVLSLAASGCSSNRPMCRRMFGGQQNCQCCSPAMCNCGCNSASCSMGGCSNCQGGDSCQMCSGGAAMMGSGPVAGEMMGNTDFGPPDGTYFGSSGSPGCNCGAQ
jgi:hypothetical protein